VGIKDELPEGINQMKKAWEKPLLVVLVRSRPEENVLYGCKTGSPGPAIDSGGEVSTCAKVAGSKCQACSPNIAS